MIVKLKRRNTRYRDLTFEQPYGVIGIEGNDLRLLNDAGRPFLYPAELFSSIDPKEPADWVTEFGDDGEQYSYPVPLNKAGFFEDFFDQKAKAVATFWRLEARLERTAPRGDLCRCSTLGPTAVRLDSVLPSVPSKCLRVELS